jgi:hypothetical protein
LQLFTGEKLFFDELNVIKVNVIVVYCVRTLGTTPDEALDDTYTFGGNNLTLIRELIRLRVKQVLRIGMQKTLLA